MSQSDGVPVQVTYDGLLYLYNEACAELERLEAIPPGQTQMTDFLSLPYVKRNVQRLGQKLREHPLHQPARPRNSGAKS
jgi:hypothetical protein